MTRPEKAQAKEVYFMPTDPVCKMEISEDTAEATVDYKGRTYYFCSEACKESFVKNPESFLRKSA